MLVRINLGKHFFTFHADRVIRIAAARQAHIGVSP